MSGQPVQQEASVEARALPAEDARRADAATCRAQLRKAADALAAADLLLGMNWSTASMDRKGSR